MQKESLSGFMSRQAFFACNIMKGSSLFYNGEFQEAAIPER